MSASRFAPDDNIVLVGMPGAGKSTVGVVLAKIVNYEFVDVDLVIQQRMGATLQRLIDELGPEGFIGVEGDVLRSLDLRRTIISTGGSAVYSEKALAHLAQGGVVVYLQASYPEIRERLADFSERGVVMRSSDSASLQALFDERTPLYERSANVIVDVDGLSISEAANAVQSALGL